MPRGTMTVRIDGAVVQVDTDGDMDMADWLLAIEVFRNKWAQANRDIIRAQPTMQVPTLNPRKLG